MYKYPFVLRKFVVALNIIYANFAAVENIYSFVDVIFLATWVSSFKLIPFDAFVKFCIVKLFFTLHRQQQQQQPKF